MYRATFLCTKTFGEPTKNGPPSRKRNLTSSKHSDNNTPLKPLPAQTAGLCRKPGIDRHVPQQRFRSLQSKNPIPQPIEPNPQKPGRKRHLTMIVFPAAKRLVGRLAKGPERSQRISEQELEYGQAFTGHTPAESPIIHPGSRRPVQAQFRAAKSRRSIDAGGHLRNESPLQIVSQPQPLAMQAGRQAVASPRKSWISHRDKISKNDKTSFRGWKSAHGKVRKPPDTIDPHRENRKTVSMKGA